MGLFSKEIFDELVANGCAREARDEGFDPPPVVKLCIPGAGAIWLLSEISPYDLDLAFGLCDLGMGFPELGYVSLGELEGMRENFNMPVERDFDFRADKPLSAYLQAAMEGKKYA